MDPSRPETISALEDHLGYWLRYVSNHVSGSFALELQANRFTVAEWVALRQLHEHDDLGPADLADLLGMTRGAITKILDKLEEKNLVTRRTRKEDRRAQRLALTSDGKAVVPKLARLADLNDQRMFACLDKQQQTQLRDLLVKVTLAHGWTSIPVD